MGDQRGVDSGPSSKPIARPPSFLRAMTPAMALPLSLGFTLLVGVGDFVTGVELTFTLLYTFPIAFGTWFRGRPFGYLLAVLSAACQTLTALVDERAVSRLVQIWNLAGTLVAFFLVVWLIDLLRTYMAKEQREKALVVSQLRHADRLHLIGRLAAGVAHELGTPLNVITGSAELLMASNPTPAALDKFTTMILVQADRMTGIIRHLLEFGRRGGSARTSQLLDDLTVRASELLQPIAQKRKCTIVVERSSKGVRALVNTAEIEQVLSNMILNGIQAMPDGGTLRLRTHRRESRLRGGITRTFSCISVEDEGMGIDPADLPHIFDPFFTTKGIGEGTGLGLSVSYGIVTDHGGTIDVKSEKGHGSRFSLLLPFTDDEAT